MDVYTKSYCIYRKFVMKARHLDTHGAKERRRMIIQGSEIKRSKPSQVSVGAKDSNTKEQSGSGKQC